MIDRAQNAEKNAQSAAPAKAGAALCAALVLSSLGAQARQPAPKPAQPRPTPQQTELERVRHERTTLEQQMRALQGTVHDLSEEVGNLDRQADATSRLVVALDGQLLSIDGDVQRATGKLTRAQQELDGKHVVLRRRLVDIYKRGPLYTAEALLSAASFGELVTRYKYLHELALRDRSLVRRVEVLRDDVAAQHSLLLRLRAELARNREEKSAEEQRLRALEAQRGANLTQAKRQAASTSARLAEIARDEARLATMLASIEAERRKAESRPAARPPAASTLKPADTGRLGWPVDGSLLYRFGRVVSANNTSTRWNGIGIAAPFGTRVQAVAGGEVVLAETMGTYGLTVIVRHGAGDYSIYGSLANADVRKGATVTRGQIVGTVGRGDPELPPHLHFEVRPNGHAVDPLTWLRAQR